MIAGFDPFQGTTIESLRQFEREWLFADPVFAREQQRARHTPRREHPPQNLFRALVSDESIKHKNR